ncbi:MAG: hypothetical protein PHH82_01275 [Candidatus ainarchaeum sp.]|nr:hypothetical protein [Candidatus ainarchaeum sp.]
MPKVREPFVERLVHNREGGYRGTLTDHFSADGRLEKRRIIIELGRQILERRTRLHTSDGVEHIQDVYNDRGQYDGSVISRFPPALDERRTSDKVIFDLESLRKEHQKMIDSIVKGEAESVSPGLLKDWLYNANFSNPVFESPQFIKGLAICLSKAEPDFFKLFSSSRMNSFAKIIAENVGEFYVGLRNPTAFQKSLHAHRYFFAKELELNLMNKRMSKNIAQMYVFKITGVNLAGEGRLAPGSRPRQ